MCWLRPGPDAELGLGAKPASRPGICVWPGPGPEIGPGPGRFLLSPALWK